MEAERWDARTICRKLQITFRPTIIAGYVPVLRSKCQKMSDRELKDIFDYAFNSRNAKACTAMMTVMEERGLAYEDDNGRIVRTYRQIISLEEDTEIGILFIVCAGHGAHLVDVKSTTGIYRQVQ